MLEFFLSYLLIYTYLVIFLVTLTTSIIFPLPATAIIIASGAFVAQGYLNINYVLISSFLGCTIGDITGYFISYFYGRDILLNIGFGKIINSKKFAWLENYFQNNSTKSIFFSRFLITGLCSSVNILSGLTKISYKKFLSLDIIGEIIYVTLFSYLGFILGNQWQNIALALEDILTILVIVVIFTIILKFKFGHKKYN
ncbi:DedA family protein [Candidatus Gracilibacteria bacterium]|nr:DedA family protein [Candidatus Gracilibacteria bacterium]